MAVKRRKIHASPRLDTRWQQLAPAGRSLLAAVTLHEGELTDAQLGHLAADPAAVDELVAAGWLQEAGPGRWQLPPSVGADALRALIPWSLRRTASLQWARWWDRTPAGAARAAPHYESVGALDDAGRCWLAAARDHCRRHHHHLAAGCFAHAVRLLPPATPEDELVAAVRDFGTCAALKGDLAAALELLQTWRDQPAFRHHAWFQAEAGRVQAALLERSARHVESASARRATAEWFTRAGRPAEAASELLGSAYTLVYALHLTAARDDATAAIAAARASEQPAIEAQATSLLGLALGALGRAEEGRRHLEAALQLALRHGLTSQAADAYRLLGTVEEYASRYGDQQGAFNRALSYCRRHDQGGIAELCLGCYSYSLFRSGQWKRSLALARRVHGNRRGQPASRCVAGGVLGLLHAHRGERKSAVRYLEESIAASRRTGIGCMELFGWWGLGCVHEAAGDDPAAATAYRRLMEFWRTTSDVHDATPGFTSAVLFHARRGEAAQAQEYAAALQRMAAANPNPELNGAAALATAELKRLGAEPAAAVAATRQAIESYQRRHLTVEVLRAQLVLGDALAAAGDPRAAARAWREARTRAARLGCRLYSAQAAARLEASARPAAPAATTPVWDTLSPRQREVARLLATGRTNKEIAAELGLSVRTVDMHVAHVFARLDCRTRAEAAARLAAAG